MSLDVTGNTNVTTGPDGGLIVYGACTVQDAMKNIPGSNEADLTSEEVDLEPGEGAVSLRAHNGSEDAAERLAVFNTAGRPSANAEAMAIVSVPWRLPLDPIFRPPVLGDPNNPIVAYLRSVPIPISRMNMRALPAIFDLPGSLDVNAVIRKWAGFSGDCYSGWSTDTRTPDLQHSGYGSYYAGDLSVALTVLCAKGVSRSQKRTLAALLVQRGLDLMAAFADGRQNWMVDGGHMWGRWPLVIFAGIMLGIPQVFDPGQPILDNLVEYRAFYEDQPQGWFQGAWWWGFPIGWKRGWSDDKFLWKHPSQWTTTANGNVWAFTGYFEHIMGAHVGIVMCFRAMGYRLALGGNMTRMVELWMSDLPASVAAALNANDCSGVVSAWGHSYSATGDGTLCSDLWDQSFER
ncbi:MAG: hypothetical protein H6590_06075 [Flavobacteriales bacterium]|nr:hypothetical protein [Flavobacteriales bacterium]